MAGERLVLSLVLLTLTSFLVPVSPVRRQVLSLYSGGDGEVEGSENYTRSTGSLEEVSPIVRARRLQSVCSQTGV
jgi:hypothetical protein